MIRMVILGLCALAAMTLGLRSAVTAHKMAAEVNDGHAPRAQTWPANNWAFFAVRAEFRRRFPDNPLNAQWKWCVRLLFLDLAIAVLTLLLN
jgi:hypothetical protein